MFLVSYDCDNLVPPSVPCSLYEMRSIVLRHLFSDALPATMLFAHTLLFGPQAAISRRPSEDVGPGDGFAVATKMSTLQRPRHCWWWR